MNDDVTLNNNSIVLDSFAKHFDNHIHIPSILTKYIKPILDAKIIRRLNPIEALKYFKFNKFQICIEERIKITSLMLTNG